MVTNLPAFLHLRFFVFLLLVCNAGQSQGVKLILPIGHTLFVTSAEFSPDGRLIITASADNTVKVWNAETGMLINDFKIHREGIISASISKDGRRVLTGAYDSTARVLNIVTGKIELTIGGSKVPLSFAEYSPDEREIITTYIDGTIKIWNSKTGELLKTMKGATDVNRMEFSPDGKALAVSYDARYFADVWDVDKGSLLFELKGHNDRIQDIHWSPDGKTIITASWDRTVKIWNASDGKLQMTLKGHRGFVVSARYLPTQDRVVTTSMDSTARVWDCQTGKPLFSIPLADKDVNEVNIVQRLGAILVTSDEGRARVFDYNSGALLFQLKGHSSDINTVRFSPDGRQLVTSSNDGTAKVWDMTNGKLLLDLTGHTQFMTGADFSPDNKSVITTSLDGTAKIWDPEKGSLSFTLKGHTGTVCFSEFSHDGRKVLTCSNDSTIRIWNTQTGELLYKLEGYSANWSGGGHFSPDDNMIVYPSVDVTAKIFDLTSGTVWRSLKGHTKVISSTQFSSDGKLVVTTSEDRLAKIWDVSTGQKIVDLKGHTFDIISGNFSPDNKIVLTSAQDGTAKVWDTQTGRILHDLKAKVNMITSGTLSPTGDLAAISAEDGTAKLWNVHDGSMVADLKNDTWVTSCEFFPRAKKVITVLNDLDLKIWDSENGKLLKVLSGHSNWVMSAKVSSDEKKVLTESLDNTCKIWDVESGKPIYTFFAVDSSDYFYQIPSGYYKCTPDAARLLHYATRNLEVITFDQLDIKYNRPDRVLSATGYKDTALIAAYLKAYQKRIQRLKIDTTMFRNDYVMPRAEIVNRTVLRQEGDRIRLKIHAVDTVHILDRFNVWVNQVPVYGLNGISLKRQRRHVLDTTVSIQLSNGMNRLEASVINTNGAESYHMPVEYKNPENKTGKVYFIGIGINKFSSGKHGLIWSVNDIRSLAGKFREKFGDNCIIDTLFDEQVSVDSVKRLKPELLRTGVNDIVVLAYSGHGILSRKYDYYLSSYEIDFAHPDKKGIAYEQLEDLLDSIPARRKLILLDACNSGEIDKGAAQEEDAAGRDTDPEDLIARAKKRADEQQNNGGVLNQQFFELMQQLFANVGRNTGSTVISASSGTQLARSGGSNGVFTASVLEFLQNDHCAISALKKYVNNRVAEVTEHQQVPTTRAETYAVDWDLW